MICIYTSNISIFRTIQILLPIPLYYHDSIIAKVTIAMHRQFDVLLHPYLQSIFFVQKGPIGRM